MSDLNEYNVELRTEAAESKEIQVYAKSGVQASMIADEEAEAFEKDYSVIRVWPQPQ
jgi:hypothetical protein